MAFLDGLIKHNLALTDIQVRLKIGSEKPIEVLLGSDLAVLEFTLDEAEELAYVLSRAVRKVQR